jgi:alpha,alpha-trehalase
VDLARRAPERDPEELWRDIRAAAESGWDFSSRWLGDGVSLETIRTTRLIPIDLNALLFGLEEMIVNEAKTLGDNDTAKQFAQRAGTRRQAIQQWLWNDKLQHYADYDLDANGIRDELTAASAFALFVGVASHDRASATAQALQQLLHPGGLMTTLQKTDQQWDAPNGWAPLQWVATVGLRRYGQDDFARRIAKNWTDMVANHFVSTGQLLEKYDVAACRAGGGGEYGTEIGFGWTNGVTLEYLSRQC